MPVRLCLLAAVAVCAVSGGVLAQTAAPAMNTRLPDIPIAQYTDEQKQAAAEFEAARKGPPQGPFLPLMHSPRVMTQARAMGDYLRFNSAIGTTLSELAILMTAREWSQDYEWLIHAPIAEKAGISRDIIDAIHDGRRPEKLSEDEAIIYDFSNELLRTRRVSDPTFARMEKRFGKKGVIDLTGIHGYYTLLAMQMNVARYQPPQPMPRLKRFPD
jgi:4-carboxymuconolactone decarboxylase